MSPSLNWLADGYGGKRAFLRYLASRAEAALGRHAALSETALSRVERLIFVCKGNICRSPFAEHAARATGIRASSAGLDADPGHPAAPRAVEAARKRGIELRAHRSRSLLELAVGPADLLVVFEPEHALRLRGLLPSQSQLTLLGVYARVPCAYLHDPYGLSERYFDNCFGRIEDALQGLRARLPAAAKVESG
jgi:protein-tyrosine phosphatase